jgi:hypothetical protein
VREEAVILAAPSDGVWAGRLERLTVAFGVACSRATVEEFCHASAAAAGKSPVRLLGSSRMFLAMFDALDRDPAAGELWPQRVHSAFVAAGADPMSFERLVKRLTGDARASLTPVTPDAEWSVSDQLPEFCQSMSGIHVAAATNSHDVALAVDESKAKAVPIISNRNGAGFVRVQYRSVPTFLSTGDVVDVDAPLAGRNFDVRANFLAAVPPVLYLKWAFADTCWQPPETAACVVIDDPPLRPRYGFLDFQHLLGLMERANFSTSIAFIPWNWNRSEPTTVRLFRHNPGRFSLSVHGCDHTHHEFGIDHLSRLAWKSREAMQRMARHESKTGLSHDPVMVFPHGVFSEAAMAVLKRAHFIGVVNSEVMSADAQLRTIKVSDYWDVAVMSYSDFPIFTRRYPWQGIENFAYDILLGKPCIVCVHHNDCHDDCRHVVEFIERLNKLNVRMMWRNLGDVIRRSFRQRAISPGFVDVEMYGHEIRIENTSPQKKAFRISKRECAATAIREIRAGRQVIEWTATGGRIAFDLELGPGESQTIALVFNEAAESGFKGESVRYRMKTMVRRYLCEVRDNYIMRKSFSQ